MHKKHGKCLVGFPIWALFCCSFMSNDRREVAGGHSDWLAKLHDGSYCDLEVSY